MKILVIGESCKDIFVYGECNRICPEAPVPVIKPTHQTENGGMSKNVYNNLIALGVSSNLITNTEKIVKRRYVDDGYNQMVLRVDTDDECSQIDESIRMNICNNYYAGNNFDAILISDYNKGFLSEQKILELVECFDGPVFIDTKKNHLPKLNAFVKINEHEYKNFKSSTDNLIITRGNKGCEYKGNLYPTEKVDTFDAIGAGDTFLSALVYFYLLYGTIEYAIPYANKAATISVSHFGTYVLHEEDVNGLF